MRTDPAGGRYVLVVIKPHRCWMLARMGEARGDPIELIEDRQFDDRAEAEREVFKRRWRALTGEVLSL